MRVVIDFSWTTPAPALFPGIEIQWRLSIQQMELIGRLHPLLIHFPIALVIAAVAAEAGAMLTRDARWRQVGITNLRAGALWP